MMEVFGIKFLLLTMILMGSTIFITLNFNH